MLQNSKKDKRDAKIIVAVFHLSVCGCIPHTCTQTVTEPDQ